MPEQFTADIRKEIRFAVVLYGGVSLAIYISGVVRELLTMVQATSPEPGQGQSQLRTVAGNAASVALYRELANLLNSPGDTTPPDDVVYTRFVVDVIAGTSAGGLNGIYLAKALAHGQNLDSLRTFWIEKGDIASLLNEDDTAPRSVLSGDSMLDWLHDAFTTMQPAAPTNDADAKRRAFVDDVQVVATTTDLSGLPIFLQTSDRSVEELRHRNTYTFQFSNGTWRPFVDNFRDNEWLLALASRSTSSFPGAFAPARALDVKAGLTDQQIALAYPDYRSPDASSAAGTLFDPLCHAFADGGILNNKPFTHVISALGSRRGGKPSDRKLVYVEPSPELVSAARGTGDATKPDFFSVIKAAFTLPGQQNIRQDLERVEERNRLIGRMTGVLADIPSEVETHSKMVGEDLARLKLLAVQSGGDVMRIERLLDIASRTNAQKSAEAFKASDVGDLVQIYGLGYAGYHRLKVASVTDDLTTLMTKLIGARPDSWEWRAIRYFVRGWRDLHYAPYLPANATIAEKERHSRLEEMVAGIPGTVAGTLANRRSETAFLLEYDLQFLVRRLDYVLNKIDDLNCMDDRAHVTLRAFKVRDSERWLTDDRRKEMIAISAGLSAVYSLLQWRIDTLGSKDAQPLDLAAWQVLLLAASGRVKAPRTTQAQRTSTANLSTLANSLGLGTDVRQAILALPESGRDAYALREVAARLEAFDSLARELHEMVMETNYLASDWAQEILPPLRQDTNGNPSGGDIARFFYDHYESVDRISFPVFYQTDVGQETDIVSVVRISPDDCTSIAKPGSSGQVHKLGGETFGHFGGFFAKEWRASDYLWGQLDGAERLVRSVCANSPIEKRTAEFVRKAQLAILSDTANVAGIRQLECLSTSEARLAFLESGWHALLAPPEELSSTLATSVATVIGILGKIVRGDSQTLIGRIARRLGPPLLWLARSVVQEDAGYTFVLLATALCVIAGWALTGAAADARTGIAGAGLLSLGILWLLLRFVGGVCLIAIVIVAQVLRGKIAAALAHVLKS